MTLKQMLADPSTPLEPIAAWLDSQSHEARLAATRALGRGEQRRLYQLAQGAPPLSLVDFVPEASADLAPVRHHGTNTLPLPGGFRRFEKRFCRPAGETNRLFGYNEGASRPLIGPGYFVALSTDDRPDWQAHGSVVVDYFQVPDAEVAPGWPAVKPNSAGLQVLVYHQTRDYMRRVSQHVTIGAAFKKDKALDHYFTLVRED